VDAVVLGAGITGLVSASILVEQGLSRILVVDEYGHIGGNHIDLTVGPYTFDIGSLIFQDDSPLLAHFPELLPNYEPIWPTWAKLNPQGVITRYPFSMTDDFLSAGLIGCSRMLFSVALARIRRRKLNSAGDFAEHWLGPRFLHRSGLDSYMERFCGLPIHRIDLKFAEKRMGWISEHARLIEQARRFAASRRAPLNKIINRQLARPRSGFAALYQPAVTKLEQRGVTFVLKAELTRLRRVDSMFELQLGDRQIRAPRVISTIPIDRALELCGLSAGSRLPSVTLITLLFTYSGRRGFAESVLYNFSHEGAWKRLTIYSDFYGKVEDREYFAVEVIADRVDQDVQRAVADFRAHTHANALFKGDLQLVGSHLLPSAYPIYTDGSADRADAAIAQLRGFGLESFGRQGGFQYQPTARVSTLEAEAALRPR
jgi:protoporphyrinogen oxidase